MHDSSVIDMSDEAKFCMNDEKIVFSNITGDAELTIEELNNLRNGLYKLKIEIVPCTQEQYDALEVKDPNTLYLIGD